MAFLTDVRLEGGDDVLLKQCEEQLLSFGHRLRNFVKRGVV